MTESQTPAPNQASTEQDGFAGRVRSAVAWRWGSQVIAQIITWTSTFLVVRLLDPTDYGLFAMSQVIVTALAFLNGQSFATSIVQTHRLDDRRVGQVFGMLLLANGFLAAVQFALAPLAAAYFEEPVVAEMLRVQAMIFLIIPFIALPSEWLARQMQFRRQGQANMASAVVGACTALLLAWLGWGVWALVYSGLSIFIARGAALMVAAKLWVKPIFDPRGAWDLFTYGGMLTLCQLFWIIQSQSDVVIGGRLMTTFDLGLYTQALFLTLILTGRFIPPLNEVALAAYSELNRAGKPLGPYFLKTARMVMMLTAPLYIGLALTSGDAILVLMGEKWLGIIPLVAGLSLAMPLMALHFICSPTTNAIGKPQIYLSTSIAGAIIMPAAFLWGAQAGSMGLVHAWWIAAPCLTFITLSLTLPRIGVSPIALMRELLPTAVAVAAMAGAVILVQTYMPLGMPILDLALSAMVGGVTYAATFWIIWPNLVKETWALLRQRPSAPSPA
ncbi:MAG: lipopolysaccharide biosynthesis protein [Erythrobacter sp.]